MTLSLTWVAATQVARYTIHNFGMIGVDGHTSILQRPEHRGRILVAQGLEIDEAIMAEQGIISSLLDENDLLSFCMSFIPWCSAKDSVSTCC